MPSFYGFKFIDPEAEFCMILTNDYIGKINRIIQEKYSNNNLHSSLLAMARDRKIDKIL